MKSNQAAFHRGFFMGKTSSKHASVCFVMHFKYHSIGNDYIHHAYSECDISSRPSKSISNVELCSVKHVFPCFWLNVGQSRLAGMI